jgi:hypothetical protein
MYTLIQGINPTISHSLKNAKGKPIHQEIFWNPHSPTLLKMGVSPPVFPRINYDISI